MAATRSKILVREYTTISLLGAGSGRRITDSKSSSSGAFSTLLEVIVISLADKYGRSTVGEAV